MAAMSKSAAYELVVMFAAEKNDVMAEKSVADKCKKNDLKVLSVDKWGVKTLAYPINKQNKALYLFYKLEGMGSGAKALAAELKSDEDIIRYLLIKN